MFDTEIWEQGERRAQAIADAVQKIVSPYWINLHYRIRDIPPDVAPSKIRAAIKHAIDETRAGRMPLDVEQEIPGTTVSFVLWGDHHEGPQALGIQRPEVRSLNGYAQVERALDDKASKYPEIVAAGLPLIVALCSGSFFAIDEEQVLSGVYGTRQVTLFVPRGPVVGPIPPPTMTRRGGMLGQRTDGQFNNREISAVLYVWEDLSTRDGRLRAKVLHHPDPLVRLPAAVFSHLAQTRFARKDDDTVNIDFTEAPTDFNTD